eukprot:6156306-Prymnesium_polylepis.1
MAPLAVALMARVGTARARSMAPGAGGGGARLTAWHRSLLLSWYEWARPALARWPLALAWGCTAHGMAPLA